MIVFLNKYIEHTLATLLSDRIYLTGWKPTTTDLEWKTTAAINAMKDAEQKLKDLLEELNAD